MFRFHDQNAALLLRVNVRSLKLNSDEHLVVVEFFTAWCTKCPKTTPWIEELEQIYENAVFLKVRISRVRANSRIFNRGDGCRTSMIACVGVL